MSVKADFRLLELLADGRFHSGSVLSETLSVTRAAIWKKIAALKHCGIDVYAVKGKGYRLSRPLECLQRDKIESSISPAAAGCFNKLSILRDIDSTNGYLLALINRDSFHAHAVLAEYQTAGRGRRGSQWVSPFAAGICLSFGWHYPEPVETINLVSLAAGVAVMRAFQELDIAGAGLKWPNDIHWKGRKLGGILVEMRMESAGPCNVVVGVGLNYSIPERAGREIDQPWVDIASIKNPAPSRNRLAAVLIGELARMLAGLQGHPSEDIIAAWREHDCMIGKQASLVLPGRQLQGMVAGIDDDGALLFADGKRPPRRYHAGEISLKRTL